VDYSPQTAKHPEVTTSRMFGDELRKAREEAKLSQEKLAFEAELDRTYISHLENNHKSPTLDVVFRLCDAMKIEPAELIRRVDESRKA